MKIQEYLEKTFRIINYLGFRRQELRPWIVCEDGFKMSVQASEYHYCKPRISGKVHYSHVEVGFPNAVDEELLPYAEDESKPTKTVYGYVPVEIVDKIIEKHGGIAENNEEEL